MSSMPYLEHEHAELSFASPVLGVYVDGYTVDADRLEQAATDIRGWLDQYLVVIVRDQSLEPRVQRDLVKHFGPLFMHHQDEGVLYVDGVPEVLEMRKEPEGSRLFGGSDWHADVTFRRPAGYLSCLHAQILPPLGGDTGFASCIAAWETLSPGMQEFLGQLDAVHSYSGPGVSDHPSETAIHPVVRTHPVTGKRGLYLNRMFATRFDGMTEDESRPILEFLDRHMTRTEFTFRHRWQEGDLVFWDNRFTLHYPINDFVGHRRLLHRCTALEA